MRGLIQLVNKLGVEPITLQEEREFENLLPTVAEMIKQADEVKYVGDLASNMHLRLSKSKEQILDSTKMFEERDMAMIFSAMTQVVKKVDKFVDQKRKNTLKENFLTNTIFNIIREEEVIAAKQAEFEARRQTALMQKVGVNEVASDHPDHADER